MRISCTGRKSGKKVNGRLGRVIQVEDTQNRLVDYEYDSLSRRTKLVYPDDSFITYEYDALSRLTKIIDDSNTVIAEYAYDALSRRTRQILENDANTVYTYDLANRLTSLDNTLSDPNNPLLAFDYTYDNVGNRLTMTVDNAALHSYTYDAIYQLTYADYPAGQGADTAYGYDSVFNRTSVNNGSVTNYSVNGLNQYTAVGSASLTYDNNGNLTGDGVYTYEYDIENHLLVVKQSGTAVVSYNYNASGRRISKSVYPTSQYIEYCYDGDQVIAEYDGAGTLLRKFIYGPGVDEPICMIDTATGSRYYYHYDGLGSVVALSNNSGVIVERYRYSAFGQTQILSPNYELRTTSLVGNPYLFTGRDYEASIGLYYYRARFYSPEIGRFLQTDPIGYADGLNWYAYCGNNPVNFIDPMGLCGLRDGLTSRQRFGRDLMIGVAWTAGNGAQLIANTFQGLQDTAIGMVNFATAVGYTAQNGYSQGSEAYMAPSPQWARDRYWNQSGFVYEAQKFTTSIGIGWGIAKLSGATSRTYYGSKGLPDHQAKVAELRSMAQGELRAGERILQEQKVRGIDGLNRNPDIQIVDPSGRTRKVFEAERYPNRQWNIQREQDYQNHGLDYETHPLK